LEFIHHAESPDLRAFASRSGKMIIWHGWSDPLPQPVDTIAYYERVDKFFKKNVHGRDKTRVEDFARLFLLPNVGPRGAPAAGGIDASAKARAPTRGTPQPRAFRGTDAKELPILSPKCASLRMFMVENLARVSASPASDAILTSARKRSPLCSGGG